MKKSKCFQLGDKVVVIGDVFHVYSSTYIGGANGIVKSIIGDDIEVELPKGTLPEWLGKGNFILRFNKSSLIHEEQYKHYKSALSKLTKEERNALGV